MASVPIDLRYGIFDNTQIDCQKLAVGGISAAKVAGSWHCAQGKTPEWSPFLHVCVEDHVHYFDSRAHVILVGRSGS